MATLEGDNISERAGAHYHHHEAVERLMVVANRLPVKAERIGQKQWRLEERDGGGLVSALRGLFSFTFPPILWVFR